jgi:hypothetical protein
MSIDESIPTCKRRCLRRTSSATSSTTLQMGLSAGPSTVADLASWDARLMNAATADMKTKFIDNVSCGVCGNTSFSGTDMIVDGVKILTRAAAAAVGLPAPPVDFVNSNDVDHCARIALVMLSQATTNSAACVLGNVDVALSASANEMVQSNLMPPRDASNAIAKEHYQAMRGYLLDSASAICSPEAGGFCLVHHMTCPVHPGWVEACRLSGLSASQVVAQMLACAGESAASAPVRLEELVVEPWWIARLSAAQGSQNCDDNDVQHAGGGGRALVVNIAGIPCLDYTRLGKRKTDGGPTAKDHAIYFATRKALAAHRLEDLYITECSDTYHAALNQVDMAASHYVLEVKTGPELHGSPIRRRRTFAAGVSKASFVWVGPPLDEIQQDFNKLFHRSMVLTGEVFLQDTPGKVLTFHAALAAARNKVLPDDAEGLSVADYLDVVAAPGVVQIKSEYEREFASLGLSPPLFADLAHHPYKGPQHGSLVPSLDTHPKIYVWRNPDSTAGERFMTPMELLSCHGVDVFQELSAGRSLSALPAIVSCMSLAQQFRLVGNSVHVPTLSAWAFYVIANMVPVGRFFQIAPVVGGDHGEVFEDPDDSL